VNAARHEEEQMDLPLSLQNVERLVDAFDQIQIGAVGLCWLRRLRPTKD
jgi:hypothetical protein